MASPLIPMCGRFTLKTDTNALAQHFEIEVDESHFPPPRYNIAPTQAIPVIRLNPVTGERELVMQRWGLIPSWAQPSTQARPLPALFNARAETVAQKPAFREAFRARRCLIPADGFYEWQKLGKRKQPWYIRRAAAADEGGLFAFAGIWEGETCTIITTPPIPLLARLHDRMPAMPAAERYRAWLDPGSDPMDLLPMLAEPPGELTMHPVSLLVNRAACDEPGCIELVAAITDSLPSGTR